MAQRPLAAFIHEEDGFRWRAGDNVSRIEGFSDGVFAFAITLLVMSLEVPKNYADLMRLVQALPAFAVTFTGLVGLWYAHFIFFRRYGLQDPWTVFFNGIMLFVVITYLYPMKFLTTLLISEWFGLDPGNVSMVGVQAKGLLAFYGIGIAAVYGALVLLYARAYRVRAALELTPQEIHETVTSMLTHGVCGGFGVVSTLLILCGGTRAAPFAGFVYFGIGPTMGVMHSMRAKSRKKL